MLVVVCGGGGQPPPQHNHQHKTLIDIINVLKAHLPRRRNFRRISSRHFNYTDDDVIRWPHPYEEMKLLVKGGISGVPVYYTLPHKVMRLRNQGKDSSCLPWPTLSMLQE